MKVVNVVFAICICAMLEACMQQQWRGHRIFCCSNGTAIESPTGQKVWVVQKPLICKDMTNKEESDAGNSKILKVLFVIVTCAICACCCWYKCPVQNWCRRMSKCCMKKTGETVQPENIDIEAPKTEKKAKLPRSQSL